MRIINCKLSTSVVEPPHPVRDQAYAQTMADAISEGKELPAVLCLLEDDVITSSEITWVQAITGAHRHGAAILAETYEIAANVIVPENAWDRSWIQWIQAGSSYAEQVERAVRLCRAKRWNKTADRHEGQ